MDQQLHAARVWETRITMTRTISTFKYTIVALITLVLFSSCTNPTPLISPSYTSSPSKTVDIRKTETPTPFPTIVPTSIQASPTATMLAATATPTPLSKEQIDRWILDKINNRGNCELPCWWDVIPGKTTWDEALAMLQPFASEVRAGKMMGDTFSAYMAFDKPPEGVTTASALYISFIVKNNIIQTLSIDSVDQVSTLQLPNLLKEYGPPSGGVWVDGYSGSAFDYGPRQVAIHIYYPDSGVFAQYDAPGGEVKSGNLYNCLAYGPLLYLWSPEAGVSYNQAIQGLGLDFQFPFLPSRIALGMDEQQFYEAYKDKENNQGVCLKTPVDLWIWGFGTPVP